MKTTYRIAKGWEIFIWICVILLMGLVGRLGAEAFLQENFNLNYAIGYISVAILFELLLIFALMDITKRKWIIDNDSIIEVGVFKTKKLFISEIEGFTTDDNYMRFIPKQSHQKKIKASRYIGNYHKLRQWAEINSVDLDLEENIDDIKEVLNNPEYGYSYEERSNALLKTKKHTKILNIIAIVLPLLLLFIHEYMQLSIAVIALIPIFGLLMARKSKGLIRLDVKAKSKSPNLITTFTVPSAMLILYGLLSSDLLNSSDVWMPFIAISFLMTIIFIYSYNVKLNFSKGITYSSIVLSIMLSAMYSYGFILSTNTVFDSSKGQFYKAEVLNKRISEGENTTTYYLELSPWGPRTEIDDGSVSEYLYNDVVIGDTVLVQLRDGVYNIPYFDVYKYNF